MLTSFLTKWSRQNGHICDLYRKLYEHNDTLPRRKEAKPFLCLFSRLRKSVHVKLLIILPQTQVKNLTREVNG